MITLKRINHFSTITALDRKVIYQLSLATFAFLFGVLATIQPWSLLLIPVGIVGYIFVSIISIYREVNSIDFSFDGPNVTMKDIVDDLEFRR